MIEQQLGLFCQRIEGFWPAFGGVVLSIS